MGQYEWLRMPFRLCNASSVFQRFMNQIFRSLISINKIHIYLDDIVIATDSVTEHLKTLKLVFELMSNNRLELRLDKCSFLKPEIIYLRYLVNEFGI